MAQQKQAVQTMGNWVDNKPIPFIINYATNYQENDNFKNIRKLFDEHFSIILKVNTKKIKIDKIKKSPSLLLNQEEDEITKLNKQNESGINSIVIEPNNNNNHKIIPGTPGHNLVHHVVNTPGHKKQNKNDVGDDDDELKLVNGVNGLNETPEGVPHKYYEQQLAFYQYLSKILTKLGCNEKDQSNFFIKSYEHIISKILNKINTIKCNLHNTQYKLITKIKNITYIDYDDDDEDDNYDIPDIIDQDDEDDDKEEKENDDNKDDATKINKLWKNIKDGKFNLTLDCDYNEWMKESECNANILKNELSKILKMNPSLIKIGDNVQEGSVIIDFWVLNVWIPLYTANLQSDPIPIPYNMRPQDQIQARNEGSWYNATIMDIRNYVNQQGVNFKVHYNKIRGRDLFTFKNTEWFYSKTQADRLRVPNQIIITLQRDGSEITATFIPPSLAQITQITDAQCGHHIYVKRKGMWHRCEVIEVRNLFEGIKIKVTYLSWIFLFNDEWLNLWETESRERISLNDMRHYI